MSFLNQPILWNAVALLILMVIIFVWGRKPLLKSLDARIQLIEERIGNAAQALEDSRKRLHESEQRRDKASQQVQQSLLVARSEAQQLQEKTRERLMERHTQRERMVRDVIARERLVATTALRNEFIMSIRKQIFVDLGKHLADTPTADRVLIQSLSVLARSRLGDLDSSQG